MSRAIKSNARVAFLLSLAAIVCLPGAVAAPSKRVLNKALIDAVAFGKDDRVSALLAKGADPNARDDEGRTALMDAAFEQTEGSAYCYPDIAAALVRHGAAVNARDEDGDTALIYLAQIGSDDEKDAVSLAKYLLAHGAKKELKGQGGKTALQTARENGMRRLVRLLGGVRAVKR